MKNKLTITAIIVTIISLIIIAWFFINKFNSNNENQNSASSTDKSTINTPTPSNKTTSIPNAETMTEQQKVLFNSTFDAYKGTSVDEVKANLLIAIIKASNEKAPIRKVSLFINGEESYDNSKIKSTNTYSIKFEYDENGLICKALIQEN